MNKLTLTIDPETIMTSIEGLAANQPVRQYDLAHSVLTDREIIEAALMIVGPTCSAMSRTLSNVEDGPLLAIMVTLHTLQGMTLLADEKGEILKCPKCGRGFDPTCDQLIECPRCSVLGSTYCCNLGGRGVICGECELDDEYEYESEYEYADDRDV